MPIRLIFFHWWIMLLGVNLVLNQHKVIKIFSLKLVLQYLLLQQISVLLPPSYTWGLQMWQSHITQWVTGRAWHSRISTHNEMLCSAALFIVVCPSHIHVASLKTNESEYPCRCAYQMHSSLLFTQSSWIKLVLTFFLPEFSWPAVKICC